MVQNGDGLVIGTPACQVENLLYVLTHYYVTCYRLPVRKQVLACLPSRLSEGFRIRHEKAGILRHPSMKPGKE